MSYADENSLSDRSQRSSSSTCKPLLEVATPELFRTNAFRITGLPVDATMREITRHTDKLKMMEELGQGKSVHTGAFAFKTPPTVDQIRDAIQRLKDPEQRIIDEFFWFWPKESGRSAFDPAIKALEGGDADAAFDIWTALETNPTSGHIAMHNIAVLRHLMALEWENHYAKINEFNVEKRSEIAKLWRSAFKRWDILADDDLFWESVSTRIKQLDDPRLTSGFARRMRATLPQALDKINAELAVRYAECGRIDLAQVHVLFMHETNQGLDDVEKTAELVLAPATIRLKQQIQRAKDSVGQNPNTVINVARELLGHARCTLILFDLFFWKKNEEKNDLSDEVVIICNRIQLNYQKATNDDKSCLAILKEILPLAVSSDLRLLIEGNISVTLANAELLPIRIICEEASKAIELNPEFGEKEAERIVSSAFPLLPGLLSRGLSQDAIDRAKNEIALALLQCAVAFGNKTDKWKPCISILEQSLRLAAALDIKERISKNLDTVRRNDLIYGDLTPVSTAPSLKTTNGIGFALYGATDNDAKTGSYLSTYYFVFFAIPVFPICRYRVVPTSNGYRFFGKAPLRKFDKWHLAIFLGILIWLLISSSTASTANSSTKRDSYTPSFTPSPSASTPTHSPSYTSPTPTPPVYITPPVFTTPSPYTVPSLSSSSNKTVYRVSSTIKSDLEKDNQAIEIERTIANALEGRLEKSAAALESEKAKSKEWQRQLDNLGKEVDKARIYLDNTSQAEVNEFNRKVNRYNTARENMQIENQTVNKMIDGYNELLDKLQTQNRVVNRLVDAYNAKLHLYGR